MGSDDWARPIKTQVDLEALIKNKPNHAECDLFIKRGKNPNYVGLYCCQHQFHLSWLNPVQVRFLENLGIPNPNSCYSCTKEEYEITAK